MYCCRTSLTDESHQNPPLITEDVQPSPGLYCEPDVEKKLCVKLKKVDFPGSSFPGRIIAVPSVEQSDTSRTPASPIPTERQLRHRHLPENIYEEKDEPVKKRPRQKWTEEKEQLLCKYWERETLLYDAKHPDHRKTPLRNEAYERIAALLQMDGKYLCFSLYI